MIMKAKTDTLYRSLLSLSSLNIGTHSVRSPLLMDVTGLALKLFWMTRYLNHCLSKEFVSKQIE